MPKLTGDLTLEGTNDKYTTEIEYSEDSQMIGLSLSLTKPHNGGGGGGGVETQTIDESTVRIPANFSFPENNVIERTNVSGTDGAYGLSAKDNTGYYYFEVEILAGSSFTTSFGISWNTGSELSAVFSHSVRLSDGMNRVNGSNAGSNAGWQAMSVGDSLRYWYKNGNIYIGQIINGVASVVGDPAAGTGHVYTVSPNADIRGALIFGANAKYKYKALSANIVADSLGATPLETAVAAPITVTITTPDDPTYPSGSEFFVTAIFSEAVTGIDALALDVGEDVEVVNFSAVSATEYLFTLDDSGLAPDPLEITLIADAANEGNEASNTLSLTPA